MTVAPAKQASQLRATIWGPYVVSTAGVIPSVSTKLWAVAGGTVVITRIHIVVTSAFSGVATTFNMGCMDSAGADQANNLFNATAVTSKAAGATIDSTLAKITAGAPALTGGVVATVGQIDWIASRDDAGECKIYLSYYPLDDSASVG